MKYTLDTTFGSINLEFFTLFAGPARGLAAAREANKKTLQSYSGVYMYIADNGEVIYIGKAKDLNNRMQHHNQEMRVESLTARKERVDAKWVEVFEKHTDRNIKLLFTEIDSELDRQYIEASLQARIRTQFSHKAGVDIASHPVTIL